jgi:leucyl-tRNA synthetase
MSVDSSEEEVKTKAMKEPKIIENLGGKEIRKVIYVKNKLINIVAN